METQTDQRCKKRKTDETADTKPKLETLLAVVESLTEEDLLTLEKAVVKRRAQLQHANYCQTSNNSIAALLSWEDSWQEEQCVSKYMPYVEANVTVFQMPSGKKISSRVFSAWAKHESYQGCTVIFDRSSDKKVVTHFLRADHDYFNFDEPETGDALRKALEDMNLKVNTPNKRLLLAALFPPGEDSDWVQWDESDEEEIR